MYSFTNHFSQSSLRHRVNMMNRRRSGYAAWGRYGVWAMLVGVMVLACRHKTDEDTTYVSQIKVNVFATNTTRQLAAELDAHGMPWFRQSSLSEEEHSAVVYGRRAVTVSFKSYPQILCLRNNADYDPNAFPLGAIPEGSQRVGLSAG